MALFRRAMCFRTFRFQELCRDLSSRSVRIWPVSESPYIFVNILSFAALCLFGWYCSKRLPTFPKWILWGWLFTAPWVLNCSTNVHYVSYVLFGSIVFFIGFLETVPALAINAIPACVGQFDDGLRVLCGMPSFICRTSPGAPFLVVPPFSI